MNRRQKIIVSVTGIFIVLLILVGLEPGTHTIQVFDKSGVSKGSSSFTLTKSTTESVSGTTINFTDTSRVASININSEVLDLLEERFL